MIIEREVSGFTLLEVLVAVVIMAVAIVPIAITGVNEASITSHLSAYVNVMHTSGTVLNRLLKEVPFMEIVNDYNLITGEVETAVTDIRALRFGTPEVEIFADLKFQAPEDSGSPLGTCNFIYYSYRDEAMSVTDPTDAHKVFYSMKIKKLDRNFNMWRNNIQNPTAPPTEANTVLVQGELMKITLQATWHETTVYKEDGSIRAQKKPFSYSLVTMKANLTE